MNFNIEGIPRALRDCDSWVCWKEIERGGNVTKIPIRPDGSGKGAKSNDPSTWGTFIDAIEKARKKPEYGVGFMFSPEGPFVGIDLDDAIDDDGQLKPWVPPITGDGDPPWVERSPSGGGLHIIAIGDRPEWWTNVDVDDDPETHEGIEVYDEKRFFTVTGDVLDTSADDVGAWDVEGWLSAAHERVTGVEAPADESPPEGTERSEGQRERADGDRTDVDPGVRGGESDGGSEPTDVRIDVRDVIGRAYEPGTRFAHPVHGSSTGSNFMVDDGGETWRCWRGTCGDDGTTGNALHMVGMQEGILDCGEWDRSPIDSETWREIFDVARERGLVDEKTDPDYVPTPRELIARYSDRYETADDVPDSALEAFDDLNDQSPSEVDERHHGRESGLSSAVTWDEVYGMYAGADNGDQAKVARFNALRRLREADAWATVRESDTMYHYEPETGIYTPYGDSVLRERLIGGLREHFTAHELAELKTSLRGLTTIGADELGGPKRLVAVRNGVVDIDSGELSDHSHEYRFLARLGTEYEPGAECPTWRAFLDDVVPTESEILKLQEYVGYTLMHDELPFHKALFLVGPTASGKSTFLDAARGLLGTESVSSLTPQEITGEKFGGAELFGKLANIRNDIPATTLDDVGMFKEVTAGDEIKAERKFKDPFYFHPTTKFLFSANQLPDAKIDDEAFFRRILLVPFPVTVPRERRDLDLDDKLRAELPGILNWAIEGYQRLIAAGGFTGDRDPGFTEETWRRWGNPVGRFVDDCIESALDDAVIPTGDLYAAFVRYCAEEGAPSLSHHKFTRKMKQEGIEYGKPYVDGEQQRAATGVRWSEKGAAVRERARTHAGTRDPTERGLGGDE